MPAKIHALVAQLDVCWTQDCTSAVASTVLDWSMRNNNSAALQAEARTLFDCSRDLTGDKKLVAAVKNAGQALQVRGEGTATA